MRHVALLLPSLSRIGRLPDAVTRALQRAERLPDASANACIQSSFVIPQAPWPFAALSRLGDGGTPDGATWVRADPVWLRAEINGARLLGWGERLALTRADVDAFLPAVRALLQEDGIAVDALHPARWYLRVPESLPPLPGIAPEQALGADLAAIDSALPAPWRRLESELQILLHNHPHNAQRQRSGLPPINGLWCWGGGALSDPVTGRFPTVYSDDALLRGLAIAATLQARTVPERWQDDMQDALIDLRALRGAALLDDWLQPCIAALRRGDDVRWHLEEGDGYSLRLPPRWAFWTR